MVLFIFIEHPDLLNAVLIQRGITISSDQPHAIDLEIYEARNDKLPDWAPIRPNRVVINGVEVCTPSNQGITLTPLAGGCGEHGDFPAVLVATIPVFVRSLKVYVDNPEDDSI